MYCRNCGNIVADDAVLCSSCGFNPAEGSNYCPKCGHFCIPGDVECVQCKASLVAPTKLSVKMGGNAAPQPQQPEPQPQQPQAQTVQPQLQPQQSQPQPQPQQPQYKQPQASPIVPPIGAPQPQAQPQTQSQQKTIETKIGPKFLASDQRYCRNCGLVIPADAHKCPFCDAAAGSNYCQKCGSGTTAADTVCSVCSSQLTLRPNVGYIPSPPPATRKNAQQQNQQQHNRQQYAPQQPRMPYVPQGNQYGNANYNNGHYYGNNNMYGNTEQHDWLVTLLLCFFLGYLGIHRFYTKNYAAGVFQLLTGGGCGIWYIVDFILILTDAYTDGNGNKLKRS